MMKSKKIRTGILLICVFAFQMSEATTINKDSITVEALIFKAKSKSKSKPKKSVKLGKKALNLALKMDHSDLIAVSYHTIGQVYNQQDNFPLAEEYLKKWYDIRMSQDYYRQRWGMLQMRFFYSKYKKLDQLKTVDDLWVKMIDERYAKKNFENGLGYSSSMRSVYNNYIQLEEYDKAESYYMHMLETIEAEPSWLQSDMLYFKIEQAKYRTNDTVGMLSFYDNWISCVSKYASDKSILERTFKLVLQRMDHESLSRYSLPILNKLLPHLKEEASYDMYRFCMTENVPADVLLAMNIRAFEMAAKANNASAIEEHKEVFQALMNADKKVIPKEKKNAIRMALTRYGLTSENDEIVALSKKALDTLK